MNFCLSAAGGIEYRGTVTVILAVIPAAAAAAVVIVGCVGREEFGYREAYSSE